MLLLVHDKCSHDLTTLIAECFIELCLQRSQWFLNGRLNSLKTMSKVERLVWCFYAAFQVAHQGRCLYSGRLSRSEFQLLLAFQTSWKLCCEMNHQNIRFRETELNSCSSFSALIGAGFYELGCNRYSMANVLLIYARFSFCAECKIHR